MPKYTFHTTHFTHVEGESPATYQCTSFEQEADDVATAYNLTLPKFPKESKLLCWYSDEKFIDEEDILQKL